MPSLGLLLENPIFDSYNERMKTVNEKLTPEDKDCRPSIDFDMHADAIAKFKEEHIYSRMRDIEDRGGVFVIPFTPLDTSCKTYNCHLGLTHGCAL